MLIFFLLVFLFVLASYFIVDFTSVDVVLTAVQFTIVFLVSSILFLKKRRKNFLFSFELFFFIIFFFVTYAYPLFSYENFKLELLTDFNSHVVVKSLYLSTLGFLSFIIGSTIASKKLVEVNNNLVFDVSGYDFYKISRIFNRLTTFICIIFFIVDGENIFYRYNESFEVSQVDTMLSYVRIFLTISVFFEFSKLYQSNVKTFKDLLANSDSFFLLNFFLLITFFLIVGIRSELIIICINLLLCYSLFIGQMKVRTLVLFFVSGFWLMALLKFFRGFNELDILTLRSDDAFSFLNLIGEFFYSSTTNYGLVEYADLHGSTYGSNILLQILAFIPFFQSFVVDLFNLNLAKDTFNTSSVFISNYLLGTDRSWGLGTNVIGDLYYTFGLGGIIFFMFLIGLFISYLTNQVVYKKNYNEYLILFFLILCSQSFFFSRAEFFRPVRDIGFVFWILIVCKYFSNYKQKKSYL